MGMRGETCIEKKQTDLVVNTGFSCLSYSRKYYVCFIKMQPNGIYDLPSIHAF